MLTAADAKELVNNSYEKVFSEFMRKIEEWIQSDAEEGYNRLDVDIYKIKPGPKDRYEKIVDEAIILLQKNGYGVTLDKNSKFRFTISW